MKNYTLRIALLALIAGGFVALPPRSQGADKRGTAGLPVYVTASFTDKNGLFIEDLDRTEVRISENGQPRSIEFMARDEIPAVYGIIFELAFLEESGPPDWGSRRQTAATTARDIAYQIIDRHLGRQPLWVAAYDRDLRIVLESAMDGFLGKAAIQQLAGSREIQDPFVYGALFSAVRKMASRPEKRRVLLLFLSLVDSDTAGKIKAISNLLSASNVELFTLSFSGRLADRRGALTPAMNSSLLKDLAGQTAGYAFFRNEFGEHPEDLIHRLSDQIRTFYTFGFTSTSPPDKPGKLVINCTRPGSRVSHHPAVPVLN